MPRDAYLRNLPCSRYRINMAAVHYRAAAQILILWCVLSFCFFLTHALHSRRVTIAHNTKPGYMVTSVPFWGQKFSLDNNIAVHETSKYFTVLSNGDIVTSSDISSLLGDTMTLVVHSQLGKETWQDNVHIKVKNGFDILVFPMQKYKGYILENMPAGTVVDGLDNLAAVIGDGQQVNYMIISGPFQLFELHQGVKNHLIIKTRVPLNQQDTPHLKLTIKATTDNSADEPAFTKVRIKVKGKKNHVPHPEKTAYYTIINEDTPSQSTVLRLKATDHDSGKVTYTMLPHDVFDIEPESGSVILRSKNKLTGESYQLLVHAENAKKKKRQMSVNINVSGKSSPYQPHIVRIRHRRETRPAKEVEIPESMVGDLLDLKNDYMERFSFKDPEPSMLDINPVTGTVRLIDEMRLDYEEEQTIDFTVVIRKTNDISYRDEQPVRIKLQDVNDEVPEFKNEPRPFLATVSLNASPGTSVYQLMAADADEDSAVRYILESGGEDRFEVDPETGVVRTKGNQPFRGSKEYEIGVSAQDIKANTLQKSPTHSLKIYVGDRDPQFFETQYVSSVPETVAEEYEIMEVKAKSHQNFPITYELTAESGHQSNEFAIDQKTGIVDLLRKLDYEKDPQQYHLRVKAIENGRPTRTSTVSLIINLIDMNDNTPTFPLSQYIVQGIGETVQIGSDIIQVTATDLDSVTNSQLTYSVSDGNFTVQTLNNIGFIKTARRLDYDNIPDHTYNFTVVASDNGTPSRSGSAMVRVSVTNVNDEAPIFTQSIEHVQVSEDAASNTVVHVVQAYDPDGDDVTYSFKDGRLNEGPFSIDPKSGILTLIGNMDKTQVSYKLNITATDNGRCCGGTTSKSSKGLVIVEVKDINNNAPRFPTCAQYNPAVLENENVGTSVIQVQAIDSDTGANGNVTYALVKSNDQSSDRFYIEPISGIVRTADVFDREAQIGVTDYGVTVKAVDQGSPSLAGFCTFRVKIGDKNDNPPVFNLPQYETSIEESSVVGKRVKQVYATDRDAKDNGKVEYFLKNDPSGFFAINQYSGWVTVARPMTGREQVTLTIESRDKGMPVKMSQVKMDIQITQTVNSYPQWAEDYSAHPIRVTENAPINTIVKRLKAYSSIPDSAVNYIIQPGETQDQNGQPRSFHYRTDEANNEMILLTYRPLDFEALPKFYLTIKAANRATNSLHNDTRVTVEVIDENDEIPQFIGLDENGRYPGSVAENLSPGAEVITVTATDKDDRQAFKKISYKIKEIGPDWRKFTMDPQTGLVRTTTEFDRETKNEYYITVVAEDGANSDRPNHWPPGTPNQGEAEVQIRITDKNDNAPFFKDKVYTARVPENTDSGMVIISVTAADKDEENRLTYSITGGNVGNAFEVVPDLGEIKVRGNLDYENGPREYRLTYRVFDDKYANTTTVVVQITDVNDNPPRFDNAIYNVTDVQEEEEGISRSQPKYLLTVRATDPDVNRHSNIRYGLTGQFADDGTFIINEHTGEVYLTRSLDRDHPYGRPVWNFNVLAHDEPDSSQPSLTGYAEVRVMPKDVNDNSPVFDRNRLVGKVQEHSRAGMTVLTVIATDSDHGSNGTVSYSLKQVPMEPQGSTPLFSIDSHTGLISTTMADALDREKQGEFRIIVQAKDRGAPPQSSSATVTIKVDDVNDHAPEFTQKMYRTTMSENYPKGASITSVSATDRDIGNNARLTYTLRERDREYFSITSVEATNTGVLKVFKQVDYDTLIEPFFNLTVYVRDPDTTHEDVAYIEVRVTDFNDNPPVFTPNSMKVSVFENVTIGTSLARFTASDRDTGMNKQFTYAIDRTTDPDRRFAIDGHGLVTTAKSLDRENIPVHRVHILAIDKGDPTQTGVGTLIVTLTDVNDNFPTFAHEYRPIIYENQPAGQTVIEVSAIDKDTATNGPPFEFWLPCGGGCPCQANPTCGHFGFKFIPDESVQGGGQNEYGAGIVTSLRIFDREEHKEYYMPIIMKDSGSPSVTGTNTLTIIIGDVNDNKHYPGHKNIFVYNYKGEFEDAELGNVYAQDKDDWDVANKTFTFVRRDAERHFRLNADTGAIYMRGRVLEGEYNFQVKVYDVVWKREVVSSVTVIIKEINDDAVTNSGSLRLQGMTAEEFVARRRVAGSSNYRKSKYDELREFIAQKLNVPSSNVDIFTVRNHPTLPRTIDIRYSAHGSPYYRPAKLDGIINSRKDELEDLLGVHVLMTPIDECLDEECEFGGCSNHLITTKDPYLINTNGTSLIGITSFVVAECTCMARVFNLNETGCSPDSCLNGGTCHERQYDFYCTCPPEFDGPRCQQTRHSFQGNGWAWYKPLAQCHDSHTSIEFITQQDNGLILYNGPIRELAPGEPQDYMAVELKTGYPVLKINHGSGDGVVQVTGMDKMGQRRIGKLSDGRWHRLDIYREGKKIRMVVDRCQMSKINENEMAQTSIEDRSACEARGETPGENKYINVNTPLQLGGRADRNIAYPKSIIKDGFQGCIKNLVHNGELYDLHTGQVGQQMSADDGCPLEDVVCGVNDVEGLKCGHNGTCIGSFHDGEYLCRCKPGWRGPKCSIPTTTKDFREHSFIEWDFKDGFYGQLDKELHKSDFQLMFRTRQESGLLFKAQNAQKSEYLMLELVGRMIRFRYNLGSGEQYVILSHVNVSDGIWHTVYVERIGQWVVLKLDGGEGRHFNETQGVSEGHLQIRVSQRSLFAGGDVRFPSSNSPPLVDYDFENSCLNDVRYNGAWFPMDRSQNEESPATDLTRSMNLNDGCPTSECAALNCLPPLECYDMWRYAECRCPRGQHLVRGDSDDVCDDIDECIQKPCFHGICRNTIGSFTCDCHAGYTGDLCVAESRAIGVAIFSTGALLAIILSALALLLVILLFIVYTRRRRPEAYVVGVDPDDDVRENIIHYDEEGVGEEDQDSYDISRLKKPVDDNKPTPKLNHMSPPEKTMPPEKQEPTKRKAPPAGDQPDVGDFIKHRLRDADHDPNTPPHDSVREYAYEGGGSDAGSLSSLASTTESEDQNYDYLNNWGPRFQRLADMYGE